MEELPKIGIGNLDRKLAYLESKLISLLRATHEPNEFISIAEEIIQSIRHFTFTIQANKDYIPNFEEWYTPWQDSMKNDRIMKWLKNKRTELVHDDINFTSSNASIEYVVDYGVSLGVTAKDVFASTKELIEAAKGDAKENPELLHALGRISRNYIVNIENNKHELVDILGYGVMFMIELSADLSRYLEDGKITTAPKVEKLTTYVDPKETEITFKVRNGKIIRERQKRVDRDKLKINLDLIKKRYGLEKPINFDIDDPEKLVVEVRRVAKQMLLKDGFHLTLVQARNGTDLTWTAFSPMLRDRTEKFIFSKTLADEVRKRGYDRIVMVTESWVTRDMDTAKKYLSSGKQIADMDNKSEALSVSYIAKDGTCLDSVTYFERDNEGNIRFLEEHITKGKPMYQGIFWNIMVVWDLVKPEQINERTAYN